MTHKMLRWASGIVAVAAVGTGIYLLAPELLGTGNEDSAVFATPGGITLQDLKTAYGGGVSVSGIFYANAAGLPLYTYDKDVEPGKSSCVGACIATWPAATAPAGAKSFGDWSLITRDDGSVQWAYRGKPLYIFAKDAEPPKPAAVAAMPYAAAPSSTAAAPPDWHIAAFEPAKGVPMPAGISLREVPNALGQTFVDDKGTTIYAFDGDVRNDMDACTPSCPSRWIPLRAPEIARPVGQFSVIAREDGAKQWAYRGKPLYTFDGDVEPGDANGIGIDRQRHVAMLFRYFMPTGISTRATLGHGVILTTAEGMSLYNEDRYGYNPGGNSARDGNHRNSTRGRAIGTSGCTGNCTVTWRPLRAPDDAQPSGYWDVLTREDGTKQWAYRNYALYTYAGDKKPGDLTGNDIYNIVVDDGNSVKIAIAGGPEAALFWRVGLP